MDFACSDKVEALRAQVDAFLHDRILPANREWMDIARQGRYPIEILELLKDEARSQGLWNLFLPSLGDDEPGTRLSNCEYAPLAEIMGRVPWASEVFNCSAPDTGNIELLHLFATPEQRRDWLLPLLDGEIRSCIGITEPDVASSDPTNLQTTIRRDGGDYLVNGRKWFTTGAMHPNARFVIVMGLSDTSEEAGRHARHSMVIVPFDAPGVEVVRDLAIMGHHSPEGHCEVVFRNVRVPAGNLLGGEGDGFALAQARLGPGRVHHCMRTIGQCELALELMCERVLERQMFGRRLSDFANIQDWIAESRMEIDQARLLVMRAAWVMDTPPLLPLGDARISPPARWLRPGAERRRRSSRVPALSDCFRAFQEVRKKALRRGPRGRGKWKKGQRIHAALRAYLHGAPGRIERHGRGTDRALQVRHRRQRRQHRQGRVLGREVPRLPHPQEPQGALHPHEHHRPAGRTGRDGAPDVAQRGSRALLDAAHGRARRGALRHGAPGAARRPSRRRPPRAARRPR
jgi:acyl-CoA dehydrogenase